MTHFIAFDLETYKQNEAIPYCVVFYRLSILAGKYNCDFTPQEIEKSEKDTLVIDDENFITKMIDYLLKKTREEGKLGNKVIEHNLEHNAHIGCGFDTWIVSNSLSCERSIVNMKKHARGVISINVFNGYIQNS